VTRPWRFLVVCTFNQVRSVAMQAHLSAALAGRHLPSKVMSGGFARPGMPPLPTAVAALAADGLDVAAHHSHSISARTVHGADLILTAERLHVMRLCEREPSAFHRTFTLPEFVARAEAVGPRGGQSLQQWVATVATGRTPASFVAEQVPEVADPAGMPQAAVTAALGDIGELCRRLVGLL
jgi:protein-tyrosine phosphatase